MDDLISKLRTDFPELRFVPGKKFAFRYPRTIKLGKDETDFAQLLFHELGHALLRHRDFSTDIERLKMEADAWEKAKELAPNYEIDIDEEFVQKELDTYRDWLHKKSRCPVCGLTRYETLDGIYHCPRCENLA